MILAENLLSSLCFSELLGQTKVDFEMRERTQNNSIISIRLMMVCSSVRGGGRMQARSLPFRVIEAHGAMFNKPADWQFNTSQQWHNLMIVRM